MEMRQVVLAAAQHRLKPSFPANIVLNYRVRGPVLVPEIHEVISKMKEMHNT